MLMDSLLTNINPITTLDSLPRSSQIVSCASLDERSHLGHRETQRSGSSALSPYGRQSFGAAEYIEVMHPREVMTQRVVISDGMTAQTVQATSHDRLEFRVRAPVHLLVVYEQGARREGDTFVEGLPRSTLRDFSRKLTFVPAGHEYREWHEPRMLARLMYFYFDPRKLKMFSDAGLAGLSFTAKLFFEDATLLDSALKLKRSLDIPSSEDRPYLEALGVVLVHELIRVNGGMPQLEQRLRGGLAAWQQRVVTTHIDEHLGESISIATLAGLARLSPYYFCRAFKQSFGLPPHQYHTKRRVEYAKALLARRTYSVTDIGLTVGYSETSSFSAAFRKATGLSPSAYQRSLG
jgi:AraC family transcriptional regulator